MSDRKPKGSNTLERNLASSKISRRDFLRFSALAVGGAAVSGAAAACAPVQPAAPAATEGVPAVKEAPELSMWIQEYYVPEANEIIEEAAKTAAKRGNFEITLEWLPWNETAYAKWAAATEGKLPDIGMPPGYPSQYQAMGRLIDLSELFAEIGEIGGEWYDYVAQSATIDGKQYWVPIFNETAMAHYRVDLFEEAGFDVPVQDLDELLEAAKAITAPAESVWGMGMGMTHGDWGHNLPPTMWAFDAQWQDGTGNITVDTPEMVEAITWYTDLYNKHKVVPPGATGWDPSSNNKGYLAGQLAFVSNPGSILNVMRDENQELLEKTRFGPIPGRGDNPPTGAANFPGLFITTDCEHPEKAAQVIKAIMSEEFQPRFLEAGGSNLLPVVKDYVNIPFFQEDPWNQQIVNDILPYSRARWWKGVATPTFSEVDSKRLWGTMLQRVTVEGWEPAEAVEEFAAEVAKVAEKYGEA